MATTTNVDRAELEAKVQDMYRAVALNPGGEFHFEMGRSLAERVGYAVSAESIESFAGVTEVQLPAAISCNSTLWAACISGAMQRDDYRSAILRPAGP